MVDEPDRSPENLFEKARYHRCRANAAKLAELVPPELVDAFKSDSLTKQRRPGRRAWKPSPLIDADVPLLRCSVRLAQQATMAAAVQSKKATDQELKAMKAAVVDRHAHWRDSDLSHTVGILHEKGIQPGDIKTGLQVLEYTVADIVAWGVTDVSARKLLAQQPAVKMPPPKRRKTEATDGSKLPRSKTSSGHAKACYEPFALKVVAKGMKYEEMLQDEELSEEFATISNEAAAKQNERNATLLEHSSELLSDKAKEDASIKWTGEGVKSKIMMMIRNQWKHQGAQELAQKKLDGLRAAEQEAIAAAIVAEAAAPAAKELPADSDSDDCDSDNDEDAKTPDGMLDAALAAAAKSSQHAAQGTADAAAGTSAAAVEKDSASVREQLLMFIQSLDAGARAKLMQEAAADDKPSPKTQGTTGSSAANKDCSGSSHTSVGGKGKTAGAATASGKGQSDKGHNGVDRNGQQLAVGDRVAVLLVMGDKAMAAASATVADVNQTGSAWWTVVPKVKVDPSLVLLKDVKIEEKQIKTAQTAVFPQSNKDLHIYCGSTKLWDKDAAFRHKDETMRLKLPWAPMMLLKLKEEK
eukprot:gene311-524_t